jgi:arylsulfatase A-like enzyme
MMYPPDKVPLPRSFLPQHPFDNGELQVRDEKLARLPRTPEEMRRHLADYYAVISFMDAQIGRILAALEKNDQARNTIIIFSSDSGLAVGGLHGLMGKQNLYEHNKPPLLIHGPGIPKGKSEALVYLFDLFPTLCDLTGTPTPTGLDGQSLLPILKGEKTKVRDSLFGAYRDCQRMVRDERWKLLKYNAAGVRNVQLFDLANDPDEVTNLAADPRHREQVIRLEKLLVDAQKWAGDPLDGDLNRPE